MILDSFHIFRLFWWIAWDFLDCLLERKCQPFNFVKLFDSMLPLLSYEKVVKSYFIIIPICFQHMMLSSEQKKQDLEKLKAQSLALMDSTDANTAVDVETQTGVLLTKWDGLNFSLK